MRIGPSLILASRQTLAMTPQLQQAIKLLQFSHLELAAFIQQELEKNPLLAEGAPEDGVAAESDTPVVETPRDTAEALAAAAPALADADERWTREHADRGGDGTASRAGQREDAPDALDFVAERPQSLAAHVLAQLELMFDNPAERRIALKLLLQRADRVEFVRELLDLLSEGGTRVETESVIHHVLDMAACKAAVKAGDPLTAEEIAALLARRELAERSSHCPHGRPTTLHLSLADLERQFKRRT